MLRSEKRRRAHASLRGHDRKTHGVARPYLGIRFDCCHAYARIYRNRDHTAYEGRCPRCLRPIRIGIQKDGTPHRFFRAY